MEENSKHPQLAQDVKKKSSSAGFGRRTISEILKIWSKIVGRTRIAVTGNVTPDLSEADKEYIKKIIHECIYTKGSEVSSRSRSIELGRIYLGLSKTGRESFIRILARDFDTDKVKLKQLTKEVLEAEEDENKRIEAEMALATALIPPRVRLLKQFNALPNGLMFLVHFRETLLHIRKETPYLSKLDVDLKKILASWFDIGLLELMEINWNSPTSILEKLIEYEVIHEIRSWVDLKNRLDSDRFCFAFFHTKIPNEPLIFIEVALTKNISNSIQELLDTEAATIDPEDTDTAIFYSISNAHMGLIGINLGNFLIKRVIEVLSKKLKGLEHFATLSPIPYFRRWLDPLLSEGDESILTTAEVKTLRAKTANFNAAKGLLGVLNTPWYMESDIANTLKPPLMRLCAHYLLNVKMGKMAFDPVTSFHLSNGARIERVNWMGDISENGIKQSAGMMANYYYKLNEIEKNHELYKTESAINATKKVRKLIKK